RSTGGGRRACPGTRRSPRARPAAVCRSPSWPCRWCPRARAASCPRPPGPAPPRPAAATSCAWDPSAGKRATEDGGQNRQLRLLPADLCHSVLCPLWLSLLSVPAQHPEHLGLDGGDLVVGQPRVDDLVDRP